MVFIVTRSNIFDNTSDHSILGVYESQDLADGVLTELEENNNMSEWQYLVEVFPITK